MPELPEVETVRRILEPQLKGLRIVSVTVNHPAVIARPSPEEFCRLTAGRLISGMSRRGKFLSFCLENGGRIVLHLRMTGSLLLTPPAYPLEKHTHLIFHLDDGGELRFTDLRRFGRFWLIENGEEDIFSGINRLGPEPMDDGFSGDYLMSVFAKRKKAVKSCLLDQEFIAGIGNIYADESLFSAKICPERPASSLTGAEWERLAAAIKEALLLGIEENRMSAEEYLAGKGRGYRSRYLNVYGRAGKPCRICGELLCRSFVGGRGSVYCPKCQNQEKLIAAP
ncbi:DNA-formamidopyrimidine glycosylase [Cloacibacillus sp.]|uniref:DNA-formamidopyrimidine glycosylase n=1 Tax=Cloacibacillus sp. TaxID=2049023 RepID=UPI0025BF5FD7|nr:DNA-formamidopyrimidine glycosylase [Cloacibacillus sp.]MCC8058461.1 DNA-formamidopyrimidine glycosylase [Cloacibacillus sp.]